jgi:hypothetical protein
LILASRVLVLLLMAYQMSAASAVRQAARFQTEVWPFGILNSAVLVAGVGLLILSSFRDRTKSAAGSTG